MWQAGTGWREHVVMYVVRDTRGGGLGAADSLNHFPPMPYCRITWMLEGEQSRGQHMSKICVIGLRRLQA